MTAPLPSPIIGESFHVAPPAGPCGRDSVGHIIRNGERYLRVEDASGEYFRYCSNCTMRHLNGADLVVKESGDAMSTAAAGRHRVNMETTARIIPAGTFLARVQPGSLDAGRHRRGGCLDVLEAAAAIGLILFGLALISTGLWWW